ncbi:MAG: hypothetical protein ACP5FL_08100, partial [Thermoplasmatota archaeon]
FPCTSRSMTSGKKKPWTRRSISRQATGFPAPSSMSPRGMYLVAAIALAVDTEEPVAADWCTPIFVLPA